MNEPTCTDPDCGHSVRVHAWTGRRPCREECECSELKETR